MEQPRTIVEGDNFSVVEYALLLGLAQHQRKTYAVAGVPVISTDRERIIENYKAIFGGLTPRP